MIAPVTTDSPLDEWRTYDEFAAGIDTFRPVSYTHLTLPTIYSV